MKTSTLKILLAVFIIITIFALAAPVYAADEPVHIEVEQVFSDPAQSENVTYTYMLHPHEKGTPMPEGCESGEDFFFTITGHRSMHIGPFKYKKQGVFRYDVRMMVMRNKPGLVYDTQTYTIEVYVNSALDTGVVVLNESGKKADGIVFMGFSEGLVIPEDPEKPVDPPVPPVNPPVPPVNPPAPPVGGPGGQGGPAVGGLHNTGDETNIALLVLLLILSGSAIAVIIVIGRKQRKHKEAQDFFRLTAHSHN